MWSRRGPGARVGDAARAAGLALLVGCTSPAPPGTVRFIEVEPVRELLAHGAGMEETVFAWRPAEPEELARWRFTALRARPARDGTLALSTLDIDPQMVRQVELEAEDVAAVVVDIEPAAPHTVKLFWAGPDEDFSEVRETVAGVDASGQHVFDLRSHPGWRGPIRLLRIDPAEEPGAALRLGGIRGVRRFLGAESLAAAAAEPWRVLVGEELRPALLLPSGTVHERRLVVPADGLLELHYGVVPLVPAPPAAVHRLTVSVEPDGDHRAQTLLLADAPVGGLRGWRFARIELAHLEGEAVTLRLGGAMDGGDPERPTSCLAVAEPVVYSPAGNASR